MADNTPQRTIAGKYRLLSRLGTGGMGVVYRAAHLDMEGHVVREVALKMIRPGASDERLIHSRRFLQEIRAAADLRSPHIVTVHDFGQTEDEELYYVMEIVPGPTLKEILRAYGSVSIDQVLTIGIQACAALEVAQRRPEPIVHRDLKPSNLFIEKWPEELCVKVGDFGIAKILKEETSGLTGSGALVGTPHYMAPEQCEGGTVDGRTDLYALGVILHELLAGTWPFQGEPLSLMYQHIHDAPPPLPHAVPAALRELIGRLLAKRPDARPADARAVRDALAAVQRHRVPPNERAARPQADSPPPEESGTAIANTISLTTAMTGPVPVIDQNVHKTNRHSEAFLPPVRSRRFVRMGVASGIVLAMALLLVWLSLPSLCEWRLPARIAALPAGGVLRLAYCRSPPAPPSGYAPPQVQFAILAQRSGETDFHAVSDGGTLTSEVDDYLIVMRPLSPGYAYLFQVDSSGKTDWLFPRNDSSPHSSGANPVEAGNVIQVPAANERRALYLDTTTGVEHIYAVLSATRWADLEAALSRQLALPVPLGSAAVTNVNEPNNLRQRGVGGTHPIAQVLSFERMDEGKTLAVSFSSEPLAASGSFLVVERWLRHVGRP